MNVLVTAIGSMSAECVINSLKKFCDKVIGIDIYPKEWIITSKLVDLFYQVPKAKDKSYVKDLMRICNENKINYLIPLTDLEIDSLSRKIKVFEKIGVKICIPNNRAIQISRDKLKLFTFFNSNRLFNVIPTFTSIERKLFQGNNEIIAKPRNGRSSEGVLKSNNHNVLRHFTNNSKNYIFQPVINGEIVTVDTVRDKYKNKFSVARKELLRTVNGAGTVVQLFYDEKIFEIVNFITDKLDIIGCINVEFIVKDEMYYLMDINPRFSAGIAFSNKIGYDFVKNHLFCFLNKEIDKKVRYKSQIFSKRYIELP